MNPAIKPAMFAENQPHSGNGSEETLSSPMTSKSSPDDIERLRTVARLLLRRLEIEVKKRPSRRISADEPEMQKQPEKNDRLFGSKRGYVDTLVTLADLLLKLEQTRTSSVTDQEAPPASIPMGAADIALVDAFVERMRHQKADDCT